MAHASIHSAEIVLSIFPSPSMTSVVLCWLVDSWDMSGSGHRFFSSLSPNRPHASTKWNSLRASRGEMV